mmetsp:Transcript_32289/g.103644  ORF Transcript_32289/g.103644 Transcript_32289/m.103644 type:complete len:263 (-) Transcript_32289:306-1094(-)
MCNDRKSDLSKNTPPRGCVNLRGRRGQPRWHHAGVSSSRKRAAAAKPSAMSASGSCSPPSALTAASTIEPPPSGAGCGAEHITFPPIAASTARVQAAASTPRLLLSGTCVTRESCSAPAEKTILATSAAPPPPLALPRFILPTHRSSSERSPPGADADAHANSTAPSRCCAASRAPTATPSSSTARSFSAEAAAAASSSPAGGATGGTAPPIMLASLSATSGFSSIAARRSEPSRPTDGAGLAGSGPAGASEPARAAAVPSR